MTIQSDLLDEIDRFIRARRLDGADMAPTTFGRLAVNDGKFVQRLRDGKNIGLNTITKARAYIAAASKPKRRAA